MATLRFRIFRAAARICAVIAVVIASASHPALAQTVGTREDIAKILILENVKITDGAVSGEVVNRSHNIVRDVQLLIRHLWLWDRETKPGANDPSTAIYYNLGKDIAPGSRLPFTYRPTTPLAKIPGGDFETTVVIAGLAEVIPQSK